MASNIVEANNQDLKCDLPGAVVLDDVTPSITLLKFKPVIKKRAIADFWSFSFLDHLQIR